MSADVVDGVQRPVGRPVAAALDTTGAERTQVEHPQIGETGVIFGLAAEEVGFELLGVDEHRVTSVRTQHALLLDGVYVDPRRFLPLTLGHGGASAGVDGAVRRRMRGGRTGAGKNNVLSAHVPCIHLPPANSVGEASATARWWVAVVLWCVGVVTAGRHLVPDVLVDHTDARLQEIRAYHVADVHVDVLVFDLVVEELLHDLGDHFALVRAHDVLGKDVVDEVLECGLGRPTRERLHVTLQLVTRTKRSALVDLSACGGVCFGDGWRGRGRGRQRTRKAVYLRLAVLLCTGRDRPHNSAGDVGNGAVLCRRAIRFALGSAQLLAQLSLPVWKHRHDRLDGLGRLKTRVVKQRRHDLDRHPTPGPASGSRAAAAAPVHQHWLLATTVPPLGVHSYGWVLAGLADHALLEVGLGPDAGVQHYGEA
mmetsp:Transcript_42627/g.120896  ORF Transcript_42627/g.120896 Transcript_42627/m.120896 type:complete len:424 (+) Transcript_42627:1959-3230(+)